MLSPLFAFLLLGPRPAPVILQDRALGNGNRSAHRTLKTFPRLRAFNHLTRLKLHVHQFTSQGRSMLRRRMKPRVESITSLAISRLKLASSHINLLST